VDITCFLGFFQGFVGVPACGIIFTREVDRSFQQLVDPGDFVRLGVGGQGQTGE